MTSIPFSQGYVLSVTLRNMRAPIDLSIRKTIGRLADENLDSKRKQEIVLTLASLEKLYKLLDDIVENNPTLFEEAEDK